MINNRNLTADLLKGMAVILMVQVHILELFATQELYDSSLGSVLLFLGGPPAAPVFMIVMGYFVAKSNLNNKQIIIRGLKLIGLGFLLNIGLNFHLFIRIYLGTIATSPWPYLFGVDILFLAGFSIILLGIIMSLFKNNPLLYFLLILGIFFAGNFVTGTSESSFDKYLGAFFYGDAWWSYFPLIPWLAYPITGVLYYIIEPKLIRIKINKVYQWSIICLSGIILVITISYGISIASSLGSYYHHDYMYYLFIVNFIIFWSGIVNLVASLQYNPVANAIQWMGKNVTTIYIIQWLLIGNIATALYKTQNIFESFMWFIGIITITSLLTYLWNKITIKENKKSSSIILK